MSWKPDTLWWIITGHCNLKCKHCYIEAPNRKYNQVSTEDAIFIVDKVMHNGIKKFFITGGEPFLRSDILVIFNYIINKGGVITGIDSNGTIISDEIINFLKTNNVFVNISHDGTNFTNWNRGADIESKTIETIKLLINNDIVTNINTSLFPDNTGNLLDLFDTLKDIKINQWLVFSPFYTGNYLGNYKKILLDEEVNMYKILYTKWEDEGKPFDIRLGNTFDSKNVATKWNNYVCEYFRETITVFPDGQLTPCCKYIAHKDYKLFPNIFKNSDDEIFTRSLLKDYKDLKFSDVIHANPDCISCDLLDKCNMGCPMESYLENGNFLERDNRNCTIMKQSNLSLK